MIYNSSLYNNTIYQDLTQDLNISVEKIIGRCYQNSEDNLLIYWKHFPFNDILFSADYVIETDISKDFNTQYYESKKFSEFDEKIINNGHKGISINISDNKTFEYCSNSDKEIYIRISCDYDLNISPAIIKYKPIPNKSFYFMNIIEKFIPKNLIKPFQIVPNSLGYKSYAINSNLSMIMNYLVDESNKANSYLESFKNDVFSYNDLQINNLAIIYGINRPSYIGTLDFRELIIAYSISCRLGPAYKGVSNFLSTIYSNIPFYSKIQNPDLYAVDNHISTDLYFINNTDSDNYVIDGYIYFDGVKISIKRKNSLSFYDNLTYDIIKKMVPSNIYYKLEFSEV